jgi:dTDP-4-dehydrorhamnose 3,5-epimerase
MMVVPTRIPEVKLLHMKRYRDERGFFSETYSRRALAAARLDRDFVQDNHSLSVPSGVVRGLHFQIPPFEQDKLVRVIRGAILDVAVDLRCGSPTYGQHIAEIIRAEDWVQIFIPAGFAHGFCTLAPETEVLYKVSAHYAPAHDRGLLWDDPALGIAWPLGPDEAILSDKDRRHPRLAELPPHFRYVPEAPELQVAS